MSGRGPSVDEMDAPTALPDSIGIAAPDEWIQIPTETGEFDRFRTRLEQAWIDADWDRTTRRRAELLLNRIRRELTRVCVQYASVYVAEPSEEDRRLGEDIPGATDLPDQGDPDDEVLMSTCTVGMYSRAGLGATLPLSLGNLMMAYGSKPSGVDGDDLQRITNLEPPMVHDLAIGTSVRLRRLYEFEKPGVLPQRYYGESFITPLGDDEHILIAHFTTPNLPLSRVFSELFEAVAGTIELFYPDDPTTFSSDWVDA